MEKNELRTKVSESLCELGITNSKGYYYLKEAIEIYANSDFRMNMSITKELYPGIAKRFATTPTRVERSIRYSIERAEITSLTIDKKLGHRVAFKKARPTNFEFIKAMAEIILD